MLRTAVSWMGISSLLVAAACSDSTGPKPPPLLPECTAGRGFAVSLAVDSFVSIDPVPDSGCVLFPANAGVDTVEYLVVPQSATGVPGLSAPFLLRGDTVHPPMAALTASAAPLSPVERFHMFLREGERTHWYGFAPQSQRAPARFPALLQTGPPDSGSTRSFSLCAKLDCSSFKTVTATAKVVRGHIALYVDNLAPANGLNQADLDTIADTFNNRLYPLDTTAFGRESDIDNNTVVIVLMTNAVNQLVSASQCLSSGFVTGFFFAADIDPQFANDSRVNHGEIFYSMVADPSQTLSCSHSRTEVKRLAPITFVHEFQHMISFNRHVLLGGGEAEALWLNEGLSHLAEDLGGRSYLPGTAKDSLTFRDFVFGDFQDAYQYLDEQGSHFLLATAGIGTLAERGAMWLFVRFITDQSRTDTSFAATAAFTRKLEETMLTGADNVATQTGVRFDSLVARWALATWVSDLPGFTAPSTLKYTSWDLRARFAAFHTDPMTSGAFPKPFPLVPTAGAGNLTALSGTLLSGSGRYHRAFQAPGTAGFQLQFAGYGRILFAQYLAVPPAAVVPRLAIIRIR